MHDDWIQRWHEGRIGWHEHDGNSSLRQHWRIRGRRVLVPLCGKTPDMRWLAEQGNAVVGAELSERAIRDFFAEQGIDCTVHERELPVYEADGLPIEIWCGDFFELKSPRCDAHYDRGALVAMPAELRPAYVAHTNTLLNSSPERLVITLEYDQAAVNGPPWSVPAAEVLGYWPELTAVEERNAIDGVPPKFREAGLSEVKHTVWRSPTP